MATASTAAKGTHEEQDEHAGQPDGLTRLREAAIVDAADEMHVDADEEEHQRSTQDAAPAATGGRMLAKEMFHYRSHRPAPPPTWQATPIAGEEEQEEERAASNSTACATALLDHCQGP